MKYSQGVCEWVKGLEVATDARRGGGLDNIEIVRGKNQGNARPQNDVRSGLSDVCTLRRFDLTTLSCK
jgi:hypothetical protein